MITRDRQGGDLANCGAGKDRATVDRRDRVRSCERVSCRVACRTRGSPPLWRAPLAHSTRRDVGNPQEHEESLSFPFRWPSVSQHSKACGR